MPEAALRTTFEALSAALAVKRSLAGTIAHLERSLRSAFGAVDAEIRLYLEAGPIGDDPRVLVVPLVLDEEAIGDVVLSFAHPPAPEVGSDAALVVGALAAVLLWRMQSEDRVRLRKIARTDPLTGLANRLAFDERLETAMRDCSLRGTPLALTFFDIDFFKSYNDVYGHVAGDGALRAVGQLLAKHVTSESDLVARYGGEELALISEGSSESQALAGAQAFLEKLATAPLPHAGTNLGRVTVSAGISGRVPTIADSAADLMRDADRALYRAKMLGRNRVAAGTTVSSASIVTRRSGHLGAPPPFDNATVGREADISRISAALRDSRMITLVGPPGIGKSRLARAVGIAAQTSIPDGVAYVDFSVLDAHSDPRAMLGAALDVVSTTGVLVDSILEALRDRTMLLVLDDAATPDRRVETLCDILLSSAPGLAILATSRSPLGCREERVIVVPALGETAALALLRERSGLSNLGADGDAATVRRIVERAAGVPSAIEGIARHLATNGAESTLERLGAQPAVT